MNKTKDVLYRCPACGRIRFAPGKWLDLGRLKLATQSRTCPQCEARQFMAQQAQWSRWRRWRWACRRSRP